MQIIEENLSDFDLSNFDLFSDFLGYSPKTCMFFDIETTGLSAERSMVFLIGGITFEEGGWRLTQWIADAPDDEPLLLQSFFDALKGRDTVIHFNGSTFDLPFLKSRAARHGLSHPLDEAASLDLYQRFRPLKKLLSLERMNQTSLENFLGWHRKDRLTGKHMITLFQKYVGSGERGLLELLLLHNHDDMIGMTRLLPLCSYLMLFEGRITSAEPLPPEEQTLTSDQAFSEGKTPSRDAAVPNGETLSCNAAVLEDKSFSCSAAVLEEKTAFPAPPPTENPGNLPDISDSGAYVWQIRLIPEASIPVPFSVKKDGYRLRAGGREAALFVSGGFQTLCYFFPDYKNYYYLPLEDQAIHKSVAAYVDRDYRRPASPDNCRVKKSGLFFPQPEEIFSPVFKSCRTSQELYFLYSEELAADRERIGRYAASALRLLFG